MTQRERVRDDDEAQSKTGMYESTRATPTRQRAGANGSSGVDVDTTVITPTDRVRWGPIIAGLFTALSTLALLSLLGLAVGLSSYDATDRASDFGRNFGIGAGIWSAISALLAFGLGGWVAARTAAVRGRDNGLLNGALVWALAIPLLLYLVGGGIGSVLGTAAQTAAPLVGAAAGAGADAVTENPGLQATAQAGAQGLTATAQTQINQITPEQRQNAVDTARNAAWGTLLPLLLSLAAAAIGGYAGARSYDEGNATVRHAAR